MRYIPILSATSLALIPLVFSLGACSDGPDTVGTGGASAAGGTDPGAGGMPSAGGTDPGAGGGLASGGLDGVGGTSAGGAPVGDGGAPVGDGGAPTGDGGAPVSSGGAEPLPATFATLKEIINTTNPSCMGSDCHNKFEANEFDFSDDGENSLYEALMTGQSKVCAQSLGAMPLVDPGNPEGSALVIIIRDGCVVERMKSDGTIVEEIRRMPNPCIKNEFENGCLSDAQVKAVEDWITAGALEN